MKLKVDTHDGKSFETEVDNYEAKEVNEQLNNNDVNTIVLGDLIISRINVKSIFIIQ